MFQRHAINKITSRKINDKKVNNTESLLTQFGDKHTYSGDYQARKEILVYTNDLGPIRLDFNLRTPRSEIPSHYPTVKHNPCYYQTIRLKTHKWWSCLQTNNYDLAYKLWCSTTSFQLNKQSLTCIKMIQERLTINSTKLASTGYKSRHTNDSKP